MRGGTHDAHDLLAKEDISIRCALHESFFAVKELISAYTCFSLALVPATSIEGYKQFVRTCEAGSVEYSLLSLTCRSQKHKMAFQKDKERLEFKNYLRKANLCTTFDPE